MTDPFLFVLAILTLLGTPGPTNTLLATSGAAAGIRASLPLLAAELSGYLAAGGLIRLVLGPVLAALPGVGIALKLVVAAYLVVLAIRLLRRKALATEARPVTFRDVLVTTLLNPKAPVVALAVIPAGVAGEALYWVGFALLVPLMGGVWIGIGRGLGLAAGARVLWLTRAAGAVLIVFAGLIGLSAFAP